MKKFQIVFSIIMVFAMSACSMENNTTTAPEEKKVQEETVNNDLETDSKQEEDSEETAQVEPKEDPDENKKIDVDLRGKLITEGSLKEDAICLFRQEDFDDDGTDEAFALVTMNN